MENWKYILLGAPWLAIGFLWYQQRNMVRSKRSKHKVELHDKKGKINTNILE